MSFSLSLHPLITSVSSGFCRPLWRDRHGLLLGNWSVAQDTLGKDPETQAEKSALLLPRSGCRWWEPSSVAVKNTAGSETFPHSPQDLCFHSMVLGTPLSLSFLTSHVITHAP